VKVLRSLRTYPGPPQATALLPGTISPQDGPSRLVLPERWVGFRSPAGTRPRRAKSPPPAEPCRHHPAHLHALQTPGAPLHENSAARSLPPACRLSTVGASLANSAAYRHKTTPCRASSFSRPRGANPPPPVSAPTDAIPIDSNACVACICTGASRRASRAACSHRASRAAQNRNRVASSSTDHFHIDGAFVHIAKQAHNLRSRIRRRCKRSQSGVAIGPKKLNQRRKFITAAGEQFVCA